MGDGGISWHDLREGWELFRDPIYSAGVAGAVLGFLGVYIVLRRMVFVSAAVTQAAGLGVALMFLASAHVAFVGTFDPAYGAVLLSVIVAAMLAYDPERLGLSREALLGTVFVFCSAAAIVIQSKIPQGAHDIRAIIFGTGVLVMPEDFSRLWKSGLVIMLLHIWWFRGFTFASFDRVTARVQKVPVLLLDLALLLTVGWMVGVSARALGALPTFALSVLPAAAAVLVGRGRLVATFVLAALFGAAAGVGGYLIAFLYGLEGMGAVQTLTAALILAVALALRGGERVIRSQLERTR